jgi:hypothetical protein
MTRGFHTAGRTDVKIKVLPVETIIIIPDISSKAVKMVQGKTALFQHHTLSAKIFYTTSGLTDDQFKNKGGYNADIEDVLRNH